jgi:tripartite-type tricarboxylate transporter receptor subunit TctC
MQKYIPGNPTIVTEFMPGGGGRKAANHLYGAVAPDGLTIVNIGAGFVSNAILGEPGVKYDIDKIIYLGSGNSNTSYLFHTRKDLGWDTLEKLRNASGIKVGCQSIGHDIYIMGRLFAWLLDLKEPKFVAGYSGPAINVALMRGEVDSRASIADDIPRRTPEWLEKDLMDWHTIHEIPKGFRFRHPKFDSLPALHTFARSEVEKKVLQMQINFRLVGSPYLLPPNTPKEQVKILREAFRKVFKDPEFFANMKKLTGAVAYPLVPEEQEETVKQIPRDPEAIAVFKQIAGADPLPLR